MAYKDPMREKEYQKKYHTHYLASKLQKLKDELKALSEKQDIEAYITEYIIINNDCDEFTSTINAITWYNFLINYIKYRLVH